MDIFVPNPKYKKPQQIVVPIDERTVNPKTGRPVRIVNLVIPASGTMEKNEAAELAGASSGEAAYEAVRQELDENVEVYDPWQKNLEQPKAPVPAVFLPPAFIESEARRLGIPMKEYIRHRDEGPTQPIIRADVLAAAKRKYA